MGALQQALCTEVPVNILGVVRPAGATQRLFVPGVSGRLGVRVDPALEVLHGQLAVDLLGGGPRQPQRHLLLGGQRLRPGHTSSSTTTSSSSTTSSVPSGHTDCGAGRLAVATLTPGLQDLVGLVALLPGPRLLHGGLIGLGDVGAGEEKLGGLSAGEFCHLISGEREEVM